jgi:hypothetical protein
MSEVVSIVPRLISTDVQDSVVRVLEEMLEQARAGDVMGLGIVLYDRGNRINSVVVPGENITMLIGGMARIQYRLTKEIE